MHITKIAILTFLASTITAKPLRITITDDSPAIITQFCAPWCLKEEPTCPELFVRLLQSLNALLPFSLCMHIYPTRVF